MVDYYNLLGIAPAAAPAAVRRAFRTRAKHVHPDAHPHLPPAEREALQRRFIALAQAYETLSDPARRAAYDRQRAAAAAAEAARAQAARARRARPHAAEAGAGPRTRQQSRPERTERTAHPAPDDGASLDDLLRDVEGLLGRFGLDLRPGFEALLDALLDWARAVYRQVLEAWEGSGEPAGEEPPPARGGAKRGPAGAPPRPDSRAGAAPGRAAGSDAEEARRIQAELEALRARVRRAGATRRAGEADVEAELRRLKERLGKGR